MLVGAASDEARLDSEVRQARAGFSESATSLFPPLHALEAALRWRGDDADRRTERGAQALALLAAGDVQFYAMEAAPAAARYAEGLEGLLAHPEDLATQGPRAGGVLDRGLRYARLLAEQGAAAEAASLLKRLAVLGDEAARPNPDEHPRAALDDFAAAREALWRRRGTMVVHTPAEDCESFVDGRAIGSGREARAERPLGRRHVTVRCGDAWSGLRVVTLAAPGAELFVDPALDRSLRVSPEGGLVLPAGGETPADAAWIARCAASALGTRRFAFADARQHPTTLRLVQVHADGHVSEEPVVITAPAPPAAPKRRVWTWVAAGTGAALLGVGGYFHWDAAEATREINRGVQSLDRREQSRTLMGVFYGVGAAALAGGVVLYFVEPGFYEDETPPVVVTPTPGGGAVVGRF